MKKCSVCNEIKNVDEFNNNKASKDGKQRLCKLCDREYSRRMYFQRLEYNRKKRKEWQINNMEKQKEYVRRYNKNNRLKKSVHSFTNRALSKNKINKIDSCEKCGSDFKIEKHHENYNDRLNVQWLCRRCHDLEHYPEIKKYLNKE